jgi:adenosylmethionine-8-amino-7-oxononanoate aminotransferase
MRMRRCWRNAHLVASPDARHARPGEDAAAVAHRAADALEALLAEQHDTIAAVIVEPLVQCATGMAMHDPAYLRRVRALCDCFGVHLIADEIAVGCGRTGTFFACEQAGIWPDFLCLSKGISGGYLPLALVMTRDAIHDGLRRRRRGAQLSAFAFVHRQRAGLPRGAGHAGPVRQRRRAAAQPGPRRTAAAAAARRARRPASRSTTCASAE